MIILTYQVFGITQGEVQHHCQIGICSSVPPLYSLKYWSFFKYTFNFILLCVTVGVYAIISQVFLK